MAGIGAIIGTCSDNYQVSEVVSMVMMFFVMFGTPVYYTIEKLPKVVQYFQRLLPFSYMLESMRYVMINRTVGFVVIRDMAILLGYLIVVMYFTSRFFNWKQRKYM